MNETKNELQIKKSENGLRLAARITGSLWVAFILLISIGYLIEGYQKNGGQFVFSNDYLGLATLALLYIGLIGLIIAFWKTLPGILLSAIGFLGAALLLIIDPKLNFSLIALLVVLIPTILYSAYWWEIKNKVGK